MTELFDLIRQLTAPFGPSGCETAIADRLEALCAPYAVCSRDALGNLIAHKPGDGPRVMIAAHMDSLGLAATYVDEDGFVRFTTLGGVNLSAVLHQRVRFESGVTAVVRMETGTALSELSADKCYLDCFGQTVRPGEVAVFTGEAERIGELVLSPYLDNRIGCAIALEALRLAQDSRADLYVVFTVQEEVGTRGAGTAAFAVDPEYGFAIDVTGADDVPGAEHTTVRLGKGPVLKTMDRGSLSHPQMTALLAESAAALEIPVQYQAATSGGTDAGKLALNRGGVPTGNLAIATRHIHTPNELCSLTDAAQCAAVLAELVKRL